MKTSYEWKSGFAESAQNYIALKKQAGLKFEIHERHLRHFDTFYYGNGFEGAVLTKEITQDFIYDKDERPSSHHLKERVMRDFAIYLNDRGYRAYIPEVKTKSPKSKFVPHIFTDEEVRRFFSAIDNYPYVKTSKRNAVDPVLFRFLYSTGVRLSEALGIIISDVNAENATVTIRAAKNMKDRIIPMSDNLAHRILAYIDDYHRFSDGKTWLFPGGRHGSIGLMDKSTAYNRFRDYLLMADIPHTAKGPRIHDFRHGFAVKCLKNWVLADNDLTVMLPYLSAYMGHSDFRATQYYLRLTSDLFPEIVRRVEADFGHVIPSCEVMYDES